MLRPQPSGARLAASLEKTGLQSVPKGCALRWPRATLLSKAMPASAVVVREGSAIKSSTCLQAALLLADGGIG